MTFASASSSSCGAQGAVGDRSAATRRANSRGATYPKLLCGRSSLYSSFHAPIFARASNKLPNQLAFRHSSRSFPWKLSTYAFCTRPPRFDVHQVDLPFHPPRQKMPARKFRPVVAANRFRNSALRHDPLQLPRHSPARKTGVHFQRQTFPRVHVDHAQHAKFPPALRCIMHKVQRPLLVRSRHRNTRHARAHQAFPSLPPDHQSCFPVHPIHLLVVHVHPFRFQLQLQPPISPARLLSRRFHQPLAQCFIVPPAHIPATRLRHAHQPADAPLAHQKMLPQPVHFLPPLYELHPFFSITAFSMSLSRLRSATSFFSR